MLTIQSENPLVLDFPPELEQILFIAHLKANLEAVKNCRFVGLTYTTKKTGETARYTVQIGVNYRTTLEQSLLELQIQEPALTPSTFEFDAEGKAILPLPLVACRELIESFQDSLKGPGENKAYTKAGVYSHITPNLKVHLTDKTFELDGMLVSKVVLIPGEYKPVKSRPLTIEKDKLRKACSVSKYRSFALDLGNIKGMRINGETMELE